MSHLFAPSTRGSALRRRRSVAVSCAAALGLALLTYDPADSLDLHKKIAASKLKTRVYPAFRPDKALAVSSPASFNAWLEKLAGTAGVAGNLDAAVGFAKPGELGRDRRHQGVSRTRITCLRLTLRV